MLHLTINGKAVEVPEGSTIMEAAEAAGVKVPSLCHMKNVHQYGSCRICVVEVEGMKNLQASCMVKAREGMKVKTHSPRCWQPERSSTSCCYPTTPRTV